MAPTREFPVQRERTGAAAASAMGWLVALATLGVGAGLALHADGVFGRSIDEVAGAANGSYLLWRLGILETVSGWLEPLKFLAPAFLLAGIALTLSRIVTTIRIRASAMEHSLPTLIARVRG